MKNTAQFLATLLLFIIINLAFSLPGFSQGAKINLYIEDSIGQIDSIQVGLDNNATIGIDSALGEKNIFGKPYENLEIRTIQRDSASFNCMYPDYKIFFPENLDSKIDIRPMNFPDRKIHHFEISFRFINYPVTIKGNFTKSSNSIWFSWSNISLIDKNCKSIELKQIPTEQEIIFNITDTTVSTLIVVFDVHAGIFEAESQNNFNIFPNPFTDQLTIENKNQQKSKLKQIRIYNTLGQLEYEQTNPDTNQNIIDFSKLKHGIYFLETTDNGNRNLRQKIIKN